MRNLATLEKRVAAIETTVRAAPVRLECLQVVNLLACIEPSVKAAAHQLVTYLSELHAAGVCPAGCRCQTDQAGRRCCAVRSRSLYALVYANASGMLSAECALGTFETNVAVPEAKRCEHGAMI